MIDWRIKDNKILCLNMLNRQRFNERKDKYYTEDYVEKQVQKIQKELNCSELDATIELKNRIRNKLQK